MVTLLSFGSIDYLYRKPMIKDGPDIINFRTIDKSCRYYRFMRGHYQPNLIKKIERNFNGDD